MNTFVEIIDKQIEFNQGKNIFVDNPETFQFTNETVETILNAKELNNYSEQFLVDYATDKAIKEFCRINQYYSFNSETREELKNIYYELFKNIRSSTSSVEEISQIHYSKLKNWLKRSNPFAEKIYKNAAEKIDAVACSEYSTNIQLDILQINAEQLIQPVLDIGCGSKGHLVNYLRNIGIEAYGIDRYKFEEANLITADWLEYNYGDKKWGTIISNLGFSNHFNHHHLREDGNYIEYAKTYMNILNSLKQGGSFHYAPDVPFIERYLNNNQFALEKYKINGYTFTSTTIKRIK